MSQDCKSCAQNPSDASRDMLTHFVVNSLRNIQMEHKRTYGNVVVACDHRSWRYDVFPQYKAARKLKRQNDDSGIDWDFVSKTRIYIQEQLQTHFPYSVISTDGAEADDIIGALVKHTAEDSDGEENMFGEVEPDKVLIVSSDKDNYQLHRFKHVKQYSPLAKKLVKPESKPEHALIEKIVRGDSGDGVPSIKCPDDWFITENTTRAPSISAKYLQTFYDAKNPIDACLDEDERIRYRRNEQLVSYECTPKEIYKSIVEVYNSEKAKKHSKMGLMNFFTSKRMNVLFSKIGDFY